MKLTGQNAIEYAEANGLTLSKYNDPIEDAREGLELEEARKVASEDPNLIWIEVESKRYEVRVIGSRDDSREMENLLGLLFTSDDAVESKAMATALASAYYYGTAIVDRTEGIVDLGADENGAPLILPVTRVRIEA